MSFFWDLGQVTWNSVQLWRCQMKCGGKGAAAEGSSKVLPGWHILKNVSQEILNSVQMCSSLAIPSSEASPLVWNSKEWISNYMPGLLNSDGVHLTFIPDKATNFTAYYLRWASWQHADNFVQVLIALNALIVIHSVTWPSTPPWVLWRRNIIWWCRFSSR